MKHIINYLSLTSLALASLLACNTKEEITAIDLSLDKGTANCYIVSEAGLYSFPAVKGNSTEPVGELISVEVLWESLSTNVAPAVGDLVYDASCKIGTRSCYCWFR